ncbi:UNVERIFIED_CONTAM: hypothetical protein JM85_0072 [Acetobacter peroxydans]
MRLRISLNNQRPDYIEIKPAFRCGVDCNPANNLFGDSSVNIAYSIENQRSNAV